MFANTFGRHESVECGLVRLLTSKKRGRFGQEVSETGPIPLKSVTIEASVLHAVAQVELTQVFVNKEDQPIEAIYYFPVDPNAGVTHFHAELEGRTIQGTVKPQKEAKEQYDKAIAENRTAFLVDSNKPDIFKVRIGLLKPGVEVKVVIRYVTEVKNEKGTNAQRFFIPTTVAPRYIPKDDEDEKSIDLKNMTFSESSPAPLTISVKISLQGRIKTIESPTHGITVKDCAQHPENPKYMCATASLTGNTTDMDRDFVLLITPEKIHEPRLYAEKHEQSTALMTHFIPRFNLTDQKVELIFILDRSGSMTGSSIKLAANALMLFLHSAPVDCYFNVVGFGSTFKFLFPESRKYGEESLSQAIKHAKSLEANLGGTELLGPMRAVFNKTRITGYLRQIFVLTDGEVSNTDAVLGLTKANSDAGRVFSIGIGDSCSHFLVEGLAEAGGGTSSFVTYNEAIDAKVLQQLKNALQPSLSDVSVEWIRDADAEDQYSQTPATGMVLRSGKTVERAPIRAETKFKLVPEKIPPIYDGSQLLVFGMFENLMPTEVNITGTSPDGKLSFRIMLDQEDSLESKNGMLHKLAAIKLVRELELKIGDKGAKVDDLKKEIVGISCKHGISSKYTSFVAEDTENKTADKNWIMQTRYVPSQVAHGWHGPLTGGGGTSMGRARRGRRAPSSHAKRGNCGGSQRRRRRAPSPSPKMRRGSRNYHSSSSSPSPKRRSVNQETKTPVSYASRKDRLHGLVETQAFDGSFALSKEFANVINQKLETLQQVAKKNGFTESGFATALALAYFTEKLNDLKNSWELVEQKGRKWLQKTFQNHGAILAAALEIVNRIA